MCVIIHKPKDVVLEEDMVRRAMRLNGDGFGMAVLPNEPDGNIFTLHGFDVERALRSLRLWADHELVFHARIGTSGKRDFTNLHPFEILPNKLYVAHNGHFSELTHYRSQYSDTWRLAEHLRPFFNKYGLELLDQDFFKGFMDMMCGFSNKLAFVAPDKVYIVNKDRGVEYKGLWLSNSGPIPYHNYTPRGYIWSGDDDGGDWEAYFEQGKNHRRQRRSQKKVTTTTGETTSAPVALPPAKDEGEAVANLTKAGDGEGTFESMAEAGVLATHPFPPTNEEYGDVNAS